jgi:tRNA-2-methylthio-N6-dimethylallyladenosine synthase
VELVDEMAWAENKRFADATVEVLLAEGEGRKDDATHRRSGRARDNRLVHLADCDARPGDVATVTVTYAAPHHLVADDVVSVRRTRGGDAWAARNDAAEPAPGVFVGLPVVRAAQR